MFRSIKEGRRDEMSYWTSYKGEMKISLAQVYVDVLNAYAAMLIPSRNIEVTTSQIKMEDSWNNNHVLLEDILCFIEKYGVLTSGKIYCSGDAYYDRQYYVVQNGKLAMMPFMFQNEKKEKISLQKLIEQLSKEDVIEDFTVDDKFYDRFDNSNVSDVIHQWYSEIGDTINKEVQFIQDELKEHEDIEITIYNKRFLWNKEEIFEIPFEASEIKPLYDFKRYNSYEIKLLSDCDLDLNEERRMSIGDWVVPLFEPLMIQRHQSPYTPKLISPNGEYIDVCFACANRLKKMTGKDCMPCKPQKT